MGKSTKKKKKRFNEKQRISTKAKESELSTKTDNKKIRTDNSEKLLEAISGGWINKNEVGDMYNAIADEENAIINSSRSKKCKNKVVGIFRELK